MKQKIVILILSLFLFVTGKAQEIVAPVNHNPLLNKQPLKPVLKTTVLSLPFFEDFTGYSPFPDNAKWVDRSVYINNTMGIDPVSRGVATFDALDYRGAPYDSFNQFFYRYADSLTSQPIDLSGHTPSDSIYLSFFYQPKGRGFSPEPQDSLILYFKKSANVWQMVWAKEDSVFRPFQQVMIPLTDTACFDADFQFRFVNKASIDVNDDVWNIDYIRLAANRNINDTAINDIATTEQPTTILNDYTAMPYRHFKANMNGELAAQHLFNVKNAYNTQRSIVYSYTAREQISNTPIFSSALANDNIAGNTGKQYQFPVYSSNYNAPSQDARVVFENKYFIGQTGGTDPKENDTIIYEQVFDNYLAYDDGTAEKSYALKLGATTAAKTAIEFHLNQPDTLRGLAIYFGRQVPMAFNKYFTIEVYKNITVGSYFDTAIYQQEFNFPGYVDTINHFWIYKFDTAVALNAGTFFVGTTQPAQSGSDSLYFGLDVNRNGGNHLYINAQGTWQPSIVQGAVMIRPLLGQPVIGTDVTPVKSSEALWAIYPNPSSNIIFIETENHKPFRYEILDAQGSVLIKNNAVSKQSVDISGLSAGIYFIRILVEGQTSVPKKIIKI